MLSPAVIAQTVGRIARQGQARPCFVYHFCVADSVEERMILLRAKLALSAADGSAGVSAVIDSSSRALMRQAKVSDANSASTDRLSLANLLELLEEGVAQMAAGGGSASAAAGAAAGTGAGAAGEGAGEGVEEEGAEGEGAGAGDVQWV